MQESRRRDRSSNSQSKRPPGSDHDRTSEDVTLDATALPTPPSSSPPSASDPNRTTGSTTTPTARFTPGDLVADRYRVVAFLGKGGMGEVYRADDLELAQSVAIKILPARVAADPNLAERVRAEVRLARGITHRNVCRIHDIARLPADQGGDLFITMEYVDGEDLSTLLRRIGKLPQDKAIDVARQLCAALAAAHDQGVIHRDLKPANVMLDGRGNARLTDFGIAAIDDALDERDASSGTPAYMSPEQFKGEGVSKKSDIYSLGLVIYELLTGRPAWKADSLAQLRTMREPRAPPSPSPPSAGPTSTPPSPRSSNAAPRPIPTTAPPPRSPSPPRSRGPTRSPPPSPPARPPARNSSPPQEAAASSAPPSP
jgi:serine/threonine protein kinase